MRNGVPEELCRCERRAVTGFRVCQVHGAGSPKSRGTKGGRPVSHGVYSQKIKHDVNELFNDFMDDAENLTNIDHDIGLMRAMMVDAINKSPIGPDGEANINHGLIRAYMRDLRDAIALKSDLTETHSVPIENVKQFLNQVMFIIKRHVGEDTELLTKIVMDLQGVTILDEGNGNNRRVGKTTREKNKDRVKR